MSDQIVINRDDINTTIESIYLYEIQVNSLGASITGGSAFHAAHDGILDGEYSVPTHVDAIKFSYGKKSIIEIDGKKYTNQEYKSTGKVFPDAEMYDVARMKADGCSTNMIKTMQENNVTHAVKTRHGAFMFFAENDMIVTQDKNEKWRIKEVHPNAESVIPEFFQ